MNLHQDAFSSGQVLSKIWLAEELENVIKNYKYNYPLKIVCFGGWYGILHFILKTRNKVDISLYRSIDIDKESEVLADAVNNLWVWQEWQFKAIVADANTFEYTANDFNTVINTSVEHIVSKKWFDNIPVGTLVVLQSNNMAHSDHCHNHTSVDHLSSEFALTTILFSGEKLFSYPTWNFTRYMIIGIK